MPVHVPTSSLEALTDPATLGRLLARPVSSVEAEPVDGAQTSTEARFSRIALDGEAQPSLFLKVVDPARDWVALVTEDVRRRAVALWAEGLFEAMPPEVDPAVIACAEWDGGYAILMPNLASGLPASGERLSASAFDALLDAMAAMHAAFWGHPWLEDERFGLSTPEAFLSHTSPRRAAEHRQRLPSVVFDLMAEGWDALPAFIDTGLAAELRALNDDPAPIVNALEPATRTLVHSDIRPANVSIHVQDGAHAVSFIDWGRPFAGCAWIDLGYLLGWTALERPFAVDVAVARYQDRLQARLPDTPDDQSWSTIRDVGILGGLLNTVCFHALAARADEPSAAMQSAALRDRERSLRAAVSLL